jgi:hypothetical protein
MALAEALASWAFTVGIETRGRSAYRHLLASADRPEAAQRRTLTRIMRALANTERGRVYGFAEIRDPDDLRRRVPIADYETLRPFIDKQIGSGNLVVAPARPLMYARTSGTTGKPKLIPVTDDVVATMRRAQRAFSYVQHRELQAFRGRVLAIGGALREESLQDGTPAGSATGLIYETMPPLIRAKYVVPPEVFALEDYDLRYATIARLAVQHRSLSMIATANPSTILRLFEQIEAESGRLADDVATGRFASLGRLPEPAASRVAAALKASPRQAAVLEAANANGTLPLAELWPNLRAVMTWLGAGCAAAAAHVRELLPPATRMIDAGYVASEVRGTVVIDAASNLALPMLDDVFFEFAPVDAWDSGARETVLLHELERGRSYYVFVTTFAGLVRYDMNDVMRVTGRIGRTPTLEFVRKGRGVTNITGEKLTEDQVNAAVGAVAAALGIRVPFHLAVADAAVGHYRAYIESDDAGSAPRDTLAHLLDSTLASLNIEYSAKRASGRLPPLQVIAVSAGTGRAYREHCVRKGQRDSQFKVLTLQTAAELDFDFAAHCVDEQSDASARR